MILAVYLIFSMLAVIYFDVTRYVIPNWLVGSLFILYPLAVYLSHKGVDWKMALAGMGIVFVVGYGIFAMKWMGAGDIKLLTACALWVGMSSLIDFIFMVTLLGGALALVLWGGRKILPYIPVKTPVPLPRILQVGAPAPYGVAIALAFMLMVWMGKIVVIL